MPFYVFLVLNNSLLGRLFRVVICSVYECLRNIIICVQWQIIRKVCIIIPCMLIYIHFFLALFAFFQKYIIFLSKYGKLQFFRFNNIIFNMLYFQVSCFKYPKIILQFYTQLYIFFNIQASDLKYQNFNFFKNG